jgi:hypothetical protein
MAYLFGAGNPDRIAVTGLTPWTTRMTVFARFSLAAVNTTPRRIWTTAGSIATVLDFVSGGTNQARFGYQDAPSVSQFASWSSGFTADSMHTLVGTIDLTLSSDQVKLYADLDATPKAALTSALGPRLAETDYYLGGDGGTASLAGTLYELAYWADHALTGAQAAKLGEADGNVIGADVPMPTDYWSFVNNATAVLSTGEDKRLRVVPFGLHNGAVTGATLVAHAGTDRYPWPRIHSSVGV